MHVARSFLAHAAADAGRAMTETLRGWDTGKPAENGTMVRLAVRSTAYPS